MNRLTLPLIALCISIAPTMPLFAASPEAATVTEKDSLTIVVTDSGMGGLSVVADIAHRAEETKSYREVDIIFYNALFEKGTGYNTLPTREDKVRIFNNALGDISERYSPDTTLVACNTLSVLLPDCEVAQEGDIPIVGIVDMGVEMIEEALAKDPTASAILFSTQTTYEEDSHRSALLAGGIDEDRILVQPCGELAWYIEQDPEGFETELTISSYVSEALGKLEDPEAPVYMSFNCTHYGYSLPLWKSQLADNGGKLAGTLNPNERMADFLFPSDIAGRFDETTVTISAVSMVEIDPAVIESLGNVISPTSPETAKALSEYKMVPELFPWK